MKSSSDMSRAQTRARQLVLMRQLVRHDLGHHVLSPPPEPKLSPQFCQYRAANHRGRVIEKAQALIDRSPRPRDLFFATWVPGDCFHPSPFETSAKTVLERFLQASRQSQIDVLLAVAELDHLPAVGAWQSSVHAIVQCPPGQPKGQPTETLLRNLPRCPVHEFSAARPLTLKSMTSADGLLLYVTKQFAVLATTSRCSWRTDNGKARSRSLTLKPTALKQLLDYHSTAPFTDRYHLANVGANQ